MSQLSEEQRARTQLLVEQLSKPDFVCVCAERFCVHWQVYAVKVLSPLLDSDSQAAGAALNKVVFSSNVSDAAPNVSCPKCGGTKPTCCRCPDPTTQIAIFTDDELEYIYLHTDVDVDLNLFRRIETKIRRQIAKYREFDASDKR